MYKTNGRGISSEDIQTIEQNLHLHLPDLSAMMPHVKYSQLEYYRKRLRNMIGFVPTSTRVKHYVNDEYFSVITEQSAYWAGFIAADGCVLGSNVKLKLQEKDKGHIVQFAQHVGYTGNITHCVDKCNGVGFDQNYVIINSTQWVEDLQRIYNVTPRKSKTLAPPNITQSDHVLAFITGYIDGDGNLGYAGGNPLLQILGTYDLLSWIVQSLKVLTLIHSNARILPRHNIFRYSVSGTNVIKLVQHVTSTNLPYLTRKWEKFNHELWQQRKNESTIKHI